MQNLSVIVNADGSNEGFLQRLYSEVSEEFDATLEQNAIRFNNLDENSSHILSRVLAKSIISEFQKKILIGVINKNCTYLDKRDKLEIWKMSMNQLLDDEFTNNNDYLYRFETVRQKIYDYLLNSSTLSVEGFVNFRLGEYTDDLGEVVDMSVQEYMIELEYREFISMLKYFVSVQTPRYLTVDVIYGKGIKIFTEGNDITEECVMEFGSDTVFTPLSEDDFLLNSLIVIAPKKIIIHLGRGDIGRELKETLDGVFENKIEYRYDSGAH